MNDITSERPAREWMKLLARYREPNLVRSFIEVAISFIPLVFFVFAAWWALSIHYALSLLFCVGAAAFLVRLFLIQHDCSHGAFFKQKSLNGWVGRMIGVLTLTPFAVWRRAHLVHHSTSGNLDKRGVGDVSMLTVREYLARSKGGRFGYRLYRNPLVLFVLGPVYIFLFVQRLPDKFLRHDKKYWISAMGTNLAALALAATLIYLVGIVPFLMLYLPIFVMAGGTGIWLFYVQHQFEDTHWDKDENWDMQDASFLGSSHYDLPQPLRWFTANIGVHHVHHLNSRIPFYRLPETLRDYPELINIKRLTLWESFSCVKLQLWDENTRKLITVKQAKQLYA